MINKNQRCEMVILLKSLLKYQYTHCAICTNGTNFNDFNKVTICLYLFGLFYHMWVLDVFLSIQIVLPL